MPLDWEQPPSCWSWQNPWLPQFVVFQPRCASSASAVSSSLVLVFSSFSGASSKAKIFSNIVFMRSAAAPAEVTPTASRPSGLVEIATVKTLMAR